MKKNEKVYLGLNTFNPSYICVKQGAKRILPGRKLGLVHDTVPHLARPEYLRELPRSRSQQATQAGQDENYFLAEERKKLTMDCLDPLSSSGGALERSLGSNEGRVGMSHSSSGGVQYP